MNKKYRNILLLLLVVTLPACATSPAINDAATNNITAKLPVVAVDTFDSKNKAPGIDQNAGENKKDKHIVGSNKVFVSSTKSSNEKTIAANQGKCQNNASYSKAHKVLSQEKLKVSLKRDEDFFTINMEDAPLYDVILFFMDQLGLNCIIEPEIKGNITIHSAGKVHKDDLLPLFYQILSANGMTAVQDGQYCRIVESAKASQFSLPLHKGNAMTYKSGAGEMVIQIVPLKYIASADMVKLITPFMSGQGQIISYDNANIILLIDTTNNINKLLKLVNTFDVSVFDKVTYRFFKLKYAGSKEVIKVVNEFLSNLQDKKNNPIKAVSLDQLNTILVFANDDKVFSRIDDLLNRLDVADMSEEPSVYIYFLKNSRASDIASLVRSIYQKNSNSKPLTATKTEESKSDNNPTDIHTPFSAVPLVGKKGNNKSPDASAPPGTATVGASARYGGMVQNEIVITDDDIRNVLIIKATPPDYRKIKKLLDNLDILPRQVLISVTIADIQLDRGMDLGVEWEYAHSNADVPSTDSFYNMATGGTGFFYSVGQLAKWKATLTALASEKKVNIVATPTIMASDNVAATVNISTEIPVATTITEDTDANTNKVDIQYRNTGIILNVTPRINEYGLVTMEIKQEVSEQGKAVEVGGTAYPSFFKRSVSTTLTVQDNQTIAIGGLIKRVVSDSSNGVPFLSDIPILGWLFGKQGTGTSKSELIMLLTPKVVKSSDDIDRISKEFFQKVGYSKKEGRINDGRRPLTVPVLWSELNARK